MCLCVHLCVHAYRHVCGGGGGGGGGDYDRGVMGLY